MGGINVARYSWSLRRFPAARAFHSLSAGAMRLAIDWLLGESVLARGLGVFSRANPAERLASKQLVRRQAHSLLKDV